MKRSAVMKRSGPMKRTKMSRVSAGQRAFLAAYTKLRLQILERDGYQCQHCRVRAIDGHLLETHHVVKRSADKTRRLDPQNLVTLCKSCHSRTDFAYQHGRLVVSAEGGGKFRFELEYRDSKFAARREGTWDVDSTGASTVPCPTTPIFNDSPPRPDSHSSSPVSAPKSGLQRSSATTRSS
jgi:HNH endonuclease